VTGKQGWWHGEGLRIAVITGVLSLLAASAGAYVGGRTANEGAKEIQEAAARREAARETAAARASARLLVAELELMDLYAQRNLASRRFLDAGPEVRVELSPEDRRLLASRLSADDWAAVAQALRAATFIERRGRQLGVIGDIRPGREQAVLRRIDRQTRVPYVRDTVNYFLDELEVQKRHLEAGIDSLRELAERG
jgi:hypothetical protein